jgi:ribosome biogenesis protein MAK21
MGKKRTHAETKDGFAKPSPDHARLSAKHDNKDRRDKNRPGKQDKRTNGAPKHPKSALVRGRAHDARLAVAGRVC